jgi:hypothetical protein
MSIARPRLAFAIAIATTLLGVTEAVALRTEQDKSTATVFDGDRPVMRYRHGGVPMKPYVDQLFSPAGVQVLRDSPHDHKHHHALMFATAADGVDFWAETPGCGTQKSLAVEAYDHQVPDGTWQAGFSQEVDWLRPGSDKPLLVEQRRIRVVEDHGRKGEGLGATLVEWRSSVQPPKGKSVLSGDHYFGLGLRFLQSMDGGRFFNADDKQGEVVRGDEHLTPTKWCAYTAKADGKPVTVAVFDHPKNVRHPAKMFTMMTPFAYLSATINLWKEPLTVEAGKPLDLRYGVAVWDGEVDRATVEKVYQRWLEIAGEK